MEHENEKQDLGRVNVDKNGVPRPAAKLYFLTGFMGSGKTTAGRTAAKKVDAAFMDLDRETEVSAGMSVAEMFEKYGEGYFRRLESATLKLALAASALISQRSMIVALGGGTIIDPANAALINKFGKTIFIDCNFESCYARIEGDVSRPLVKTREELENLFKVRQNVYFENSAQVVDGECDVNILAERIAKIIHADLQRENTDA